jgi:protein-disulfide isomerase
MMVSRQALALVAAVLALSAASIVRAADPAPTSLTGEQQKAVEALIRTYILENPEVLIDSLQAYQARQKEAAEKESAANIAAFRKQLENNPHAPLAGNPKGDVTVVEFFDYRCGYCKQVFPAIQELLKTDGGVRYVFKEYPVLGPDSVVASRAAMAVWKMNPSQYLPFHSALMSSRGQLSEARIFEIATGLGIDGTKLKAAMADPQVDEALKTNFELGQAIGVQGTPAFIIGGKLAPGAISLEQMRQMIKEARAS